jgi:hypothetical protein
LSSDYFALAQYIEGLNISDLAWGTANAKTVTLSFQVYSSLTGTFGGSLGNNGQSRSYPFSYTISSANTWTTISVTIAGDTTGTWLTTTGRGIGVYFSLGAGSNYVATAGTWVAAQAFASTGSVSVVGTSGATFYITGVQLEVGTLATPFERQMYSTQFVMCQRYYYVGTIAVYGFPSPNSGGYAAYQRYDFKVTMRTTPTVATTYTSQSNITSINAGTRTVDFFTDQIVSTVTTNTTWAAAYTASAEL